MIDVDRAGLRNIVLIGNHWKFLMLSSFPSTVGCSKSIRKQDQTKKTVDPLTLVCQSVTLVWRLTKLNAVFEVLCFCENFFPFPVRFVLNKRKRVKSVRDEFCWNLEADNDFCANTTATFPSPESQITKFGNSALERFPPSQKVFSFVHFECPKVPVRVFHVYLNIWKMQTPCCFKCDPFTCADYMFSFPSTAMGNCEKFRPILLRCWRSY